jgi:hypothetical protein
MVIAAICIVLGISLFVIGLMMSSRTLDDINKKEGREKDAGMTTPKN